MEGGKFEYERRIIYSGDEDKAVSHKGEALRILQELISGSDRLQLDTEISEIIRTLSDGTVITAISRFGSYEVEIYSPEEGGEAHEGFFQCDLYTDDPDFLGDLSKQIKTSIAFQVSPEPDWKLITKRQGNAEWGNGIHLVSWDSCQNWGCTILNKRAWNDAILGPNGEDVGWPYDPRPEHASRSGELSTIVINYPLTNEDLVDESLFQLHYLAVFEPGDVQLQNQRLFVNGKEISISFPFANQYIMGACLGTVESNGKVWCTVITQSYNPSAPGQGYEYEDVWYFDPSETNPVPIKILTMYYTHPAEDTYVTNKTHLTPWAFNTQGTKGKAARNDQYFIQNFLLWGPYSDIRFIDLELSYTKQGVTASHTTDSSATYTASTIVPDGQTLTPEEQEEWEQHFQDWWADLVLKLGYPDDRLYGPIDIEYKDDELTSFGYSRVGTSAEISGYPTLQEERTINTRLVRGATVLWEHEYTGLNTEYATGGDPDWIVQTKRQTAYNPITLTYVGGSPANNIAFFVKIETTSDAFVSANIRPPYSLLDSAYSIKVSLICMFKGKELLLGSPIEYDVPSRVDYDDDNVWFLNFIITAAYEESAQPGIRSHYMSSPMKAGPLLYLHLSLMPAGRITVGELGGSSKCSEDGTHAVISCSYMDIAKFIYPWHRNSWDTNPTKYVDRWDSMDKLGVPTDLQNAWNKYMLNYAIIEKDGDIQVKQLSNHLFGKTVEDIPISVNPITGEAEYEFGIKEKDTTAFLPIGLYAEEQVDG